MPRVKVARKSTAIDMTAMCDVAFLLLTFFILTAKPITEDPAKAEVPSSSKDKLVPEDNLGIITVGQSGKIFYTLSAPKLRTATLQTMGEKYKIPFTPAELAKFANVEEFGVPINEMKTFLALSGTDQLKYPSRGIPADTTGNNELSNWILTSRQADRALFDKDLDIAIKGDRREEYPVINTIVTILEQQKKFKFSLITDLKKAPKK